MRIDGAVVDSFKVFSIMKAMKKDKIITRVKRPRRVKLTKEEIIKRMKTFSERKERFLATARTGKS